MEQLLTVGHGRDQVWLEDSGGDGPAVLLLHAGVADSTLYDDVWPQLAAQARVVRFDYRAYGRSPVATEQWSIVGDTLSVLDHLGIQRAHLVGTSMGGGGALDLAVLRPERVASLTLLCPGISGAEWPDDPSTDVELEAAGDDHDKLVTVLLRLWAAAGHEPRIVDLMSRAVTAMPNDREFEVDAPPTYDRLGEVAVPTTMVIGGADYPGLVATNRAAAALIPGCRIVELAGVDHYPSIREPATVLRLIQETASLA
jgi:pimeloyl-ACP methyl ester carboxylesterase